jgi:hypothetical protein
MKEKKGVTMKTQLEMIIVARSTDPAKLDAFRFALTDILRNPPEGIEMDRLETKARMFEVVNDPKAH